MNMVGRILWGLIIIICGLILLANNTGYLPWSLWYSVLNFWPVLIIGLGLQIAFSRWRFPGLVLAIIAMLILAALNPYTGFNRINQWRFWPIPRGRLTRPIDTYKKELKVPLGAAQVIELRCDGGSMNIEVRGDPDLNKGDIPLAASMILSWDRIEPKTSVEENDKSVRVNLDASSDQSFDAGHQDWQMRLNPSLVAQLEIRGGVSNIVLDGTSSVFDSINIETGVTKAVLNFGPTGRETKVRLKGGVANVDVNVPQSAGVNINVTGAPLVTKTNFSTQGLIRKGDVWETPDFSSTSTRIFIDVTSGVGKVNLYRGTP